MRLFQTVLIVSTAAFILGCAAPRVTQTYSPLPYDHAEYDALPKTGTGIVQGQVFARTVGGDVKKGAGNSVYLMPATKYRQEWHSEMFVGGKLPTVEDPRHGKYDKTKITDGEGRFEFKDVPPGNYYVWSSVTWKVPSGSPYIPMSTQGGFVIRKVDVSNNSVTEAMLIKQ